MVPHGRLHKLQLGNAVRDVLAIPPDAVFPISELLAPMQYVLSRSGLLNAELFELMRGEREERVPGRYLGRVFGEAAANGCQEGGVVGDERYGLGDGSDGYRVLEVADADFGCGDGGGRVEKGAPDDHDGGDTWCWIRWLVR